MSETVVSDHAQDRVLTCLAYSTMPWKSIPTTGSFPTTHASCPGGIEETSPSLRSIPVPSSITTCKVPEMRYWKCGASQLLVFAIGLTCVDHFHPG